MTTAVLVHPIHEPSPRFWARTAGAVYFSSLIVAQLIETLFPDRFDLAAGLIEIVGMSTVTLLLYGLLKPVSNRLSMVAAALNLAGIAIEAVRLHSHGTEIAMVFHGAFCLVAGYLIYKSAFLPQILGALMAASGLAWLTYLTPQSATWLSPYNTVCGLAGEVSMFLWLLVAGVNVQRWNDQSVNGGKPQ